MTLNSLIAALSVALDFTSKSITQHHKRVLYISLRLGMAMKLPQQELQQLYWAASLHDVGAITLDARGLLRNFEVDSVEEHCRLGAVFLEESGLFSSIAEVVLCHHDPWDGSAPSSQAGACIPLLSRIIHLADRLDVRVRRDHFILHQRDELIAEMKRLSGRFFCPDVFEAFREVSEAESFWLDLVSDPLDRTLERLVRDWNSAPLSTRDLLAVAGVFSKVVDSKSRFTVRHSSFVSSVAVRLASAFDMSEDDQRSMAVAGLLHDLGKVSIPESILEKPGRLTTEEKQVVRQHSYYTHSILDRIDGLQRIKSWAAFHHERLDGEGYPFRIGADDLSQGSRIMAVSDIFAALVEDRPYRPGMRKSAVEAVLRAEVADGAISGEVTDLLLGRYDDFEALVKDKS